MPKRRPSKASTHKAGVHARSAARPLRIITATSIFDGHDVSINIIRRILQELGAEVVHLGHNRGVDEVVRAAIQEDVDGIAMSSYQGGHLEFFRYLVDRLRQEGAGHSKVFVGGGGTITRQEAAALEAYGVEKVYTPEDGRMLGLEGMGRDVMQRIAQVARDRSLPPPTRIKPGDHAAIARSLTLIEEGAKNVIPAQTKVSAPVLGVTGTGGAGKSSVIDELLHGFLRSFPDLHIAVLAIDPTRHKSGGALLGDRIRLNSLSSERIYMRSMATRRKDRATSAALGACIDFLKHCGYGLVVVETAGIGQADVAVVEQVDLSLYVMTADYGAPGQLEKIQMLDYADFVALNKYDKRGGQDALREVRRQWRRNHKTFKQPEEKLPVFPTVASYWHDGGILKLFAAMCAGLDALPGAARLWSQPRPETNATRDQRVLIPHDRAHYLAEICRQGRNSRQDIDRQARAAAQAHGHYLSLKALADPALPQPLAPYTKRALAADKDKTRARLRRCYQQALSQISEDACLLLQAWPKVKAALQAPHYRYGVRDQTFSGDNYQESLSHLSIPKVAVPDYDNWGELLRFLLRENLPGHYPYTAGVFPYRRGGEDPTRMFAGEGTPERTNRRFHYLAYGQAAQRLSTAFDPITLYGEDAAARPDIYGRIGMSGVSITNLDDMKKLYSGFDLCAPACSVSMTINGPAPILLAWFLNTAIDQQVEKHLRARGKWVQTEKKIAAMYKDKARPHYRGALPPGNDGLGLGTLGVSGDQLVDAKTYRRIRCETLAAVRGTLQADILKEDQAQNECIFPLEFGLRMMGDIQEYFIANGVRNFYSVSVSGYHIAEAGANPITQLAFTLANGFTLVEYYVARGMAVDDVAPQMSFFFSNGMDPEYAVIGRVARRIWARAMREVYHANPRSQKLKYHIQTSGRTLHAQTLGFNDIRTTLQALYAIYDNCNSLHTNAYDEALTTPTEESVRRALAIQLIVNRELGLNYNQNPLQGSFIIEQLTDLVEEAVYAEFERLSERGGVFGAMETLYQRGKIQDESLYYEQSKHNGSLPIIGVNTFLHEGEAPALAADKLIRSDDEEKQAQIAAVDAFKQCHATATPAAQQRLADAVLSGANTFDVLMDIGRRCTLGQITQALYEQVGHYRRRV